ncbi:hypothetical protein FS837_005677 [Tulasnella sp. UAMH 9824]|nr:hypothetical protein FS837_005677 [Tulasnella sp. UAMH 9824]
MVATRGKKINFGLDSPEVEFDDESEVEGPAKHAAKRRKTKRSKSGEEDCAFTPGSSPGKRKAKATLSVQSQLITRRSGKGGKLRDLMNMPVDIFTELCYYIEALKKVGAEYEALSKEEAEVYLSTLKDTRDYKVEVRKTTLGLVNSN